MEFDDDFDVIANAGNQGCVYKVRLVNIRDGHGNYLWADWQGENATLLAMYEGEPPTKWYDIAMLKWSVSSGSTLPDFVVRNDRLIDGLRTKDWRNGAYGEF